MSVEKRLLKARRWLAQAWDDWERGKALWIALGLDPWGHSLAQLLRDPPPEEAPAFHPLLPQALALDKLHIPTRYPDALPGLTPKEAYTEEEAKKALEDAQAVLKVVEVRLGQG
jgi:HEPN domain-containing protein